MKLIQTFVILLLSRSMNAQSDLDAEIENDIDSEILEFSSDQIVGELVFDFKGFKNLKRISFARNDITLIPKDMIKDLHELEEIDFSGNGRFEFPETGPLLIGDVRLLNLSRCGITELPANAFDELKKLKVLDLTENPIDFEASKAFETMHHFPHRLIVSKISNANLKYICARTEHMKVVIMDEEKTISCGEAKYLPEDEFPSKSIAIDYIDENTLEKEEIVKSSIFEDEDEMEFIVTGRNALDVMMGDEPVDEEGSGDSLEVEDEKHSEEKPKDEDVPLQESEESEESSTLATVLETDEEEEEINVKDDVIDGDEIKPTEAEIKNEENKETIPEVEDESQIKTDSEVKKDETPEIPIQVPVEAPKEAQQPKKDYVAPDVNSKEVEVDSGKIGDEERKANISENAPKGRMNIVDDETTEPKIGESTETASTGSNVALILVVAVIVVGAVAVGYRYIQNKKRGDYNPVNVNANGDVQEGKELQEIKVERVSGEEHEHRPLMTDEKSQPGVEKDVGAEIAVNEKSEN